MTTEQTRALNERASKGLRRLADLAIADPAGSFAVGTNGVTVVPSVLARRVVLDLVHAGADLAEYARADDDAEQVPGETMPVGMPVIYLSAEDFAALGQREQITITIQPGDLLNPHRPPCINGSVCGEPAHCPPATPPTDAPGGAE